MTHVNEGFKVRGSDIMPFTGREKEWLSLSGVLQGDRNTRLRIQFYKKVATEWMDAEGVNVLRMCTHDKTLFATTRERRHSRKKFWLHGARYLDAQTRIPRAARWVHMEHRSYQEEKIH